MLILFVLMKSNEKPRGALLGESSIDIKDPMEKSVLNYVLVSNYSS